MRVFVVWVWWGFLWCRCGGEGFVVVGIFVVIGW